MIIDNAIIAYADASGISYTIPENVDKISYGVFNGCTNIQNIVIGDNIIILENGAFSYCKNLQTATIGNSVNIIPASAFNYCKNLSTVTLGENITYIDVSAFSDCDNLLQVYCKPAIPPKVYSWYVYPSNWCKVGSFPKNSSMKIFVPTESYDSYTNAEDSVLVDYASVSNWSDYADYIVGYDFSE